MCLQFLDTGLEKLGTPYSYGFAIILLTVLVKAATYPLSRKQVSTLDARQDHTGKCTSHELSAIQLLATRASVPASAFRCSMRKSCFLHAGHCWQLAMQDEEAAMGKGHMSAQCPVQMLVCISLASAR